MSLTFELESVWDSWELLRSPDSIEFEVCFEDGDCIVLFSSPLELVDLYNTVKDHGGQNTLIGTGNEVTVTEVDEGVMFEIDHYSARTSYRELEREFRELLREVFLSLDRISSPKQRQQALRNHPEIEELHDNFIK